MSVIWKRPDGSQNADPENFRAITLSTGDKIWVHKNEIHSEEQQWYPFQLGGDWSREEETKILNEFVNALDASDESWKSLLMHLNDDDMDPQGRLNIAEVAKNKYRWIESLETEVKGDVWEMNIIQCTLNDIKKRLKNFF